MHNRACEAHYNAQGRGKPSTVYDAIGAAHVATASFSGMRLLHRVHPHFPICPFDPPPAPLSLIFSLYTIIAARSSLLPRPLSQLPHLPLLPSSFPPFYSPPPSP